MPTIKIVPSGRHLEYHRRLLKPLLQPASTLVHQSFDQHSKNSKSLTRKPSSNKNSLSEIMKFDTIGDINSSLISKKLTAEKEENDYATSKSKSKGDPRTMSLQHSELQKYLQTLERTKKIHLGAVHSLNQPANPRNMRDSPQSKHRNKNMNFNKNSSSRISLSSSMNISSPIIDQDDVYLIHPSKVLEENTGASPRKKKRYSSFAQSSPRKETSLKIEPRKRVYNAIKRLGEDRETFMKFYSLKESLLPKEVDVHCYHQEKVSKWRPSAREGSLILFNKNILDDEQFLVYGGVNNEVLQEIVEMNIENTEGKVEWEKHTKERTCLNQYGKASKHTLELGRGGISCIPFTEVNPFNNQSRQDCVILYGNGKIVKFTPPKGEFRILNQYGRMHEDRQYHSACRFGKYMICYGGINNFKNLINKVCCFDLIEQQWKDVKIIPNSINRWIKSKYQAKVNLDCDSGPGPLYHHRCAPVFYDQREEYWEDYLYNQLGVEDAELGVQDPLIKMPKIKWQKVGKYIQQEGIYFFGGKSSLGNISNDLWCLKICNKRDALISLEMEENYRAKHKFPSLRKFENIEYYSYFQWEKMETSGTPPSPRYQHCVEYYSKMNFLIIYGGKGSDAKSEVLSDLHLLRMDNLTWLKVNLRGMPLGQRANFSYILQTQSGHRKLHGQTDSTKLVIFGGTKENLDFSNDTFVLEFDQEKIQEVIKRENDEAERLKAEEELMLLEASRQF